MCVVLVVVWEEGVEGMGQGIVMQTSLLTQAIAYSKKVANNRRGEGRGNGGLTACCGHLVIDLDNFVSLSFIFTFFHNCV